MSLALDRSPTARRAATRKRLRAEPPPASRPGADLTQRLLAAKADEIGPILFKTLEDGHAHARASLEAGGKGVDCAGELSALEDEIVQAVLRLSARDQNYDLDKGGFAALAVGGYGRGLLAPGSDVDLLFIVEGNAHGGEKVVERALYRLWDLRQKVGHATRSVEECLKQSKSDMTIRTSVLEARLLLGDSKLSATLQKRFDGEIVAKTANEFVAAKLEEREARVKRAGESRYLVEPNVKEGKGGLRDLNTLFWISKYVYRVRDPKELVAAGLFTHREFMLFKRCEEFLWAVRCHLHFIAGRAEERLSFDFQKPIALRLGYLARGGQSEAERFMKHYFLVAKDVGDLTAIVCAALEDRQAKAAQRFDRFLSRLRRHPKAMADAPDFRIENQRIAATADYVFSRDPVNFLRLFWVADRSNLPIHPATTRLVTQNLRHIDASLREDPEANRLFLEILTSRRSPELTLRRMNEAGVLGRFIPDFGHVVGMMQFSMYHHYTVDEHLLRTVGALSQIEAGRRVEDLPLLSQIIPNLNHRTCLYVACFLHDVAKGRPSDHSIAGAEIARKLCPRFGLSPGDTERVSWLVEQHLTMSNMAQGRDLADPKTAETLAGIVQSLDRLKLLLALTVCDTTAVGPGVWNGWKGQLLRTLYWETEIVLGGGHGSAPREARVQGAKEKLRTALPAWSDSEFAAYSQRHYPAYWLKTDLKRQVAHAGLLKAMAAEGSAMMTATASDAFRAVTELTIVAADHPRLLSIIAGACAGAEGNIVDAQIFTTTDGYALDTIFVTRAFDRDEDEARRAKRMADTIEQALRGGVWVSELVSQKAPKDPRAKAFALEPEVTIDNAMSRRYTVLEVSGLDRPGLLHDLTAALSRLNLNIGSAHVVTFGEKAVDSFYVTDLTGEKINAPTRQSSIKKQLLAAFEESPRAAPAKT